MTFEEKLECIKYTKFDTIHIYKKLRIYKGTSEEPVYDKKVLKIKDLILIFDTSKNHRKKIIDKILSIRKNRLVFNNCSNYTIDYINLW